MKGKLYAERRKEARLWQAGPARRQRHTGIDGGGFGAGAAILGCLPKLTASIPTGRGPNKAATKELVSLRLSPDVIDHFKATGAGWQSRIDETLRKAVKRKAS